MSDALTVGDVVKLSAALDGHFSAAAKVVEDVKAEISKDHNRPAKLPPRFKGGPDRFKTLPPGSIPPGVLSKPISEEHHAQIVAAAEADAHAGNSTAADFIKGLKL